MKKKILPLILTGTLLLGGCEKQSPQSSKTETITLSCSGTWTSYAKGEFGEQNHKMPVEISLVISGTPDTPNWTFTADGGVSLTNLNYDYPDMSGEPKMVTKILINDQLISYESHFWERASSQFRGKSEGHRDLKINRITGQWFERWEHRSETNKTKSIYKTVDIKSGQCRAAQKQF